jgi:hypothetical protein
MTKRVLECNVCGEPLAAATDEELARVLRAHTQREHPSVEIDDDRARATVASEAYDAGDS